MTHLDDDRRAAVRADDRLHKQIAHDFGISRTTVYRIKRDGPTACTEPPWGWGPKLSPAEVDIVWQQIEAEDYEARWRRGAAEALWASQGVEKLEAGT